MTSQCDIAIIGGGPVGATLALALHQSGLNIQILEARSAEHVADPRALSVSYGSRLLLERLGVWDRLAPISAIKFIHVSQKNSFGRTLVRADELKVPDLGYVVPYAALQTALQDAMQDSKLNVINGAQVSKLDSTAAGATLHYRHEAEAHSLHTRLAVIADGGKLLQQDHPPQVRDYGQSAIIAHVTCSEPRLDTAFERFTGQGPVALLPYQAGYELVWTVTHAAAQQMLQWSDAVFLAQLHQHFGDRVGNFLTLGQRACFPLRLQCAPAITLPHTVLLGNAAQTLHPVAGQGFNMGLRDACELAQEITHCAAAELGSEAMLAAYRKRRWLDRKGGIHFTDMLARLFTLNLPVLDSGRGAALSLVDCFPAAKTFVAKRMMFGSNG